MRWILAIGGVAMASWSQALGADLPLKAPALKAVYDWTGFYVGGHFGYGGGSLGAGSNPLPLQGVFLPHGPTGLIGGYQIGFNLADFTKRAYGTNYVEAVRVTINANCRLR